MNKTVFTLCVAIAALGSYSQTGAAEDPPAAKPAPASNSTERPPAKKAGAPVRKPVKAKPDLDRSGKARKGEASYYAKKFSGRKMADGTKMNPESNIAASTTLPLGTKAEVVNLENGKKAQVEIRDRGPYIEGRIVDLTPKVARELDITEQGVASVEVRPIEVPQADGSVKSGVATGSSGSGITASGK
jgi:rare lipoprotein A